MINGKNVDGNRRAFLRICSFYIYNVPIVYAMIHSRNFGNEMCEMCNFGDVKQCVHVDNKMNECPLMDDRTKKWAKVKDGQIYQRREINGQKEQ